jgi:hypothetical protein
MGAKMSAIRDLLKQHYSRKQIKEFDHLANVVIYHFADCCHKAGSSASASSRWVKRQIEKEGAIPRPNIQDWAAGKYNAFILDVGYFVLNDGYSNDYDYWGCRCFKSDIDKSDDKSLPFAGDGNGLFMLFTCFDAVIDYLETTQSLKFRLRSNLLTV